MIFSVILQTMLFWYHILHSDIILRKAVYRNEINADLNDKPSWVRMVRSVLLECDKKQVWEGRTVVNVKALINHVRVKLIEIKIQCFFRQVLDSNSGTRVNTGNKLRTCSKIKINYEREKYTEANIPLAYKKCITSTHKLEIELGRYQKPTPVPANERICRQCNSPRML